MVFVFQRRSNSQSKGERQNSVRVPYCSKHSARIPVEPPAAPCPRALLVTLAQAFEVPSEMKMTRPGQSGSTSFSSPDISDIQGPELAERVEGVGWLAKLCHALLLPALRNPPARQTPGDHPNGRSPRYCTVSAKVGEGSRRWVWPSARPSRRAAAASSGSFRI